jgi:hypothetical protein
MQRFSEEVPLIWSSGFPCSSAKLNAAASTSLRTINNQCEDNTASKIK